jgi:hypothetical protein
VADPIYRLIKHAGHYGREEGSGVMRGHDLEQWDVAAETRPLNPAGVPRDAEYHSGYVEGGVQHWLFTRKAPFSPDECERCERF